MYKFFTVTLLAAALGLASLTPTPSVANTGILETLLFGPTRDHDFVPRTNGTPYACNRAVPQYGADNVWYGLVGGRKKIDFKTRPFSRDGCFRTRSECQAFLNLVSGYLTQTFTRECRKGYRR